MIVGMIMTVVAMTAMVMVVVIVIMTVMVVVVMVVIVVSFCLTIYGCLSVHCEYCIVLWLLD